MLHVGGGHDGVTAICRYQPLSAAILPDVVAPPPGRVYATRRSDVPTPSAGHVEGMATQTHVFNVYIPSCLLFQNSGKKVS